MIAVMKRRRRTLMRMRKLSRERIQQLAGEIIDAVVRTRSVVLLKDRDAIRQAIAHELGDELQRDIERETNVRARIGAGRNGPRAGSPEYEELFRKMLEEEYLKDSET